MRRRRLFGLSAAGALLFLLIHRGADFGAITWGVVSLAVVAVAAVSFRFITRGSGSDLGLCAPSGLPAVAGWALFLAVGGHVAHRVGGDQGWPSAAAASDGARSGSPVALATALVAVAVTCVATELVRLGLLHRGIRDAVIGTTGRWGAFSAGVAAQVAALLLAGFAAGPHVTAVFCVVVASLAYEFTGSLWAPVAGQALHAALYFGGTAPPDVTSASTGPVTIVAIIAIPATSLLVACFLCIALGSTNRIAAVTTG